MGKNQFIKTNPGFLRVPWSNIRVFLPQKYIIILCVWIYSKKVKKISLSVNATAYKALAWVLSKSLETKLIKTHNTALIHRSIKLQKRELF